MALTQDTSKTNYNFVIRNLLAGGKFETYSFEHFRNELFFFFKFSGNNLSAKYYYGIDSLTRLQEVFKVKVYHLTISILFANSLIILQ